MCSAEHPILVVHIGTNKNITCEVSVKAFSESGILSRYMHISVVDLNTGT